MRMGIEVSTDKSRLDVDMIHRFLAEDSYWVRNISRRDVEGCIEHSLCFGVYLDGAQVGFARLVTDYVRFAHLMDVFILPPHRGLGLGKLLMRQIMSHPRLMTITRYTLGTSDAHGLYRQFGFQAPAHPERQMELLKPWPGG
jgi:GNAT superfamily N-acetyltransferase